MEDRARCRPAFAWSAAQARAVGFTCVELHAAHGYLLSQFLSPLSNLLATAGAGHGERRARLLLETIAAAVRAAVGQDFPIGIKLNAADFQKSGHQHRMPAPGGMGCWDKPRPARPLRRLAGTAPGRSASLKDEGEDFHPGERTVKREAFLRRLRRSRAPSVTGLPVADPPATSAPRPPWRRRAAGRRVGPDRPRPADDRRSPLTPTARLLAWRRSDRTLTPPKTGSSSSTC